MIGLSSSLAGALFLAKGAVPRHRSFDPTGRASATGRRCGSSHSSTEAHSNLTYGPPAGLSRLWSRSVLPLLKPFEELASAIAKMRADTKGGRSAAARSPDVLGADRYAEELGDVSCARERLALLYESFGIQRVPCSHQHPLPRTRRGDKGDPGVEATATLGLSCPMFPRAAERRTSHDTWVEPRRRNHE